MHEATLELIRSAHRDRNFAMDARKVMDLRLGAYLRRRLGWRKDLPEEERDKIAKEAQRLMKFDNSDDPAIFGTRLAREPFEKMEKAALKEMERLAEQLPVWETFGKPIRGFGPASLAVIVAEAGDLSNYASKSKLWKRMGVAANQGRIAKGLTGEVRKQAWIDEKYSPVRRSRMWNIGDALIKGNRDGTYRTIYLVRKEYEHVRDPEMSDMHAHRRAQRYMEKRLLRDLWQAWRRANHNMAEKPTPRLPAAHSSDRSRTLMPETARLGLTDLTKAAVGR